MKHTLGVFILSSSAYSITTHGTRGVDNDVRHTRRRSFAGRLRWDELPLEGNVTLLAARGNVQAYRSLHLTLRQRRRDVRVLRMNFKVAKVADEMLSVRTHFRLPLTSPVYSHRKTVPGLRSLEFDMAERCRAEMESRSHGSVLHAPVQCPQMTRDALCIVCNRASFPN